MKLGICLPHYGRPIEVGRILEVVRRAEDRGLDSVWVTDHVIVPRPANVIYREDMLDIIAAIGEEAEASLTGKSGWILVSTDFLPPKES